MNENLESLAGAAAAVDAETASVDSTAAPEPETVRIDKAAEVAALLQAVAGMLAPVFPCLPGIYTDPTCKRLGEAAAPVMDKYGLSVGGLFDKWGAEITLLATAFPVAMATYKGCQADLEKRREKPAESDNEKPANQSEYVMQRAT